jgi:hypothetical protein
VLQSILIPTFSAGIADESQRFSESSELAVFL